MLVAVPTTPTPLTAWTRYRTSPTAVLPSGRLAVQRVESPPSWTRSRGCHCPAQGLRPPLQAGVIAVYVIQTCWMPADGSPSTLTRNTMLSPSALGTAVIREIEGAAASAGMLPG